MQALVSFNSTVAARTSAARQILQSSELLALYEGAGGLREDLEAMVHWGEQAEALNLAHSEAQAQGGTATVNVLAAFVALQKEYSAVMAVVTAARHTLGKAGAAPEVLTALEHILQNESETTVRTIHDEADHEADGAEGETAKAAAGGEAEASQPKRKRVRRQSQEALRAEIAKDAGALLHVSGALPELARRKVDAARLTKLQADAGTLSGKLSERVVDKASAKAATAAVHEAVIEQKQLWGACYRILRAVGRQDARVAALLHAAARPR